MSKRLTDNIVRHYYTTTAGRGHVSKRDYYDRSACGLLRRLGPWLPSDTKSVCLDLACGCGEMVYSLEKSGFSNTQGVDLSPEVIERARAFVKGPLICSDVLAYLTGLPACSIDFITAFNFLEHLPKDEMLPFLSQVRRVLAPGGTIVLMVPNAVSPFGGMTRHWDMTHEWAFTPNNFRQLSPLAGFDPNIEFRECGPIAHGFASSLRAVAWRAMRAAISAWLLVEIADTKGGIYTMDMMVRLRAPAPEAAAP